MKLLPIGIHFGPHIKLNDLEALDIINKIYQGKPGVALVMEGSTWIAGALPHGSLVVQRLNWLFSRMDLQFCTEKECYELGKQKAQVALRAVQPPRITHFMGICEPKLEEVMDGRRLGAFDAGLADVFIDGGYSFCGLNSCMGKPESTSAPTRRPVIEAYALSFNQWSQRCDLFASRQQNLIWGYHAYGSPGISSKWLESRPWEFWEGDLKAVGIVMPPILATEAGIDMVGVGGYRRVWVNKPSEKYADYIKKWPSFQGIGGCFFGVLMGDSGSGGSWKERGFDFEEDEIVVSAMAGANNTQDKNFESIIDALWEPVQRRIWATTTFEKLWLSNPGLGSRLGHEFDIENYRFQMCELGFICSKIGDWANARVVTERGDMPPF